MGTFTKLVMLKEVTARIAFSAILLLALIGIAHAHSNVLIEIDLDFDPEFKAGLAKSAQKYLDTSEEPLFFGYDKGLLKVNFDKDENIHVKVEPYEFHVFGFKDIRLVHDSGEIQYDNAQRKEKAEEIFNQIPEEYKEQLVYGEEVERYEKGIFEHTWYRYVDGIYSFGDHLEVDVDGMNGNVVSWRLSLFEPIDAQTKPAFNSNVAQKIAELTFAATPLDFEPVLVLIKEKPAWIVKVKKLYPIYIAVNALDGKVIFTGALREKLPETYNIGKDVPIVETKLINELR